MRQPKRPRREAGKEEHEAVKRIFLKQVCGVELKQLLALVKKRDFPTSIAMQNDAVKILRGMVIKTGIFSASESDNDLNFMRIISGLRADFGAAVEKKSVELLISAPDGGPVEVCHSAKRHLDLKGIRNAIRRDQER